MVFMFGGIYVYVYGGEKLEAFREARAQRRKLKSQQEKDARIKADIASKQAAREEFYKTMRERSAEIKRELQRLEQLKVKEKQLS